MKKLSGLVTILVFALSLAGCNKEPESEPKAEPYQATVATNDVTYLSNKYIRARFSYSSPKFDAQTKYKGIIVSSTENTPTIENGIKGKSSIQINDDENYFNDLQVNTKYYYRGFATDGTTVVYGDVKTFTTTNASTPTLVGDFYVGTANPDGSFDVGIKVKNSYLVQEWGVELYVDGISTSPTTKWFFSKAPNEERDQMNFKYGHQGHPYYKGSKLVKRSYIKTISGVTTYTEWSYFYIP